MSTNTLMNFVRGYKKVLDAHSCLLQKSCRVEKKARWSSILMQVKRVEISMEKTNLIMVKERGSKQTWPIHFMILPIQRRWENLLTSDFFWSAELFSGATSAELSGQLIRLRNDKNFGHDYYCSSLFENSQVVRADPSFCGYLVQISLNSKVFFFTLILMQREHSNANSSV